MKKNLISVLILALLIVNLILTAVMMFSTMGSVKKTGALVTSIASVLNIELEGDKSETEEEVTVQIADMVSHDIAGLTIPLKRGDDGKDHFYLISVTLMMNSKHDDFETYGANIAAQDSILKSIIVEVLGNYTLDQVEADREAAANAILDKIQETYDSKFIYKVLFSDVLFQ